jgi:hypothetical protein
MLSGLRRAVRIEIDVIGHEQVEFAVAIVVNPGAAGPPMGSIPADTGLPGDVGKGPITVVVVKHVLTPIGDKQVLKPVVVVVAHANTGRPTGTEQGRLLRSHRRRCHLDCSCTAGSWRLAERPRSVARRG